MNILIIDAQGGGIGKALVSAVRKNVPDAVITAVGANSAATSAMLKAGAHNAATGENAVVTGCRKADIIADALFGEITPKMALSVGQSSAKRILIPINHCDNIVAGVQDLNLSTLVQQAVKEITRS